MKVKIVEVGELGTILLPIPTSVLNELGWKEGDEVIVDVPMIGDGLTIHKKQSNDLEDFERQESC